MIPEDHDRYAIRGLDKLRHAEQGQGRRDAYRGCEQREGLPSGNPNGAPNATRPDHTNIHTARAREGSKNPEYGAATPRVSEGLVHISDVVPEGRTAEEWLRETYGKPTTESAGGGTAVEVLDA